MVPVLLRNYVHLPIWKLTLCKITLWPWSIHWLWLCHSPASATEDSLLVLQGCHDAWREHSRLLFQVLSVSPAQIFTSESKEIHCFSWSSIRTASDDPWRTKSSSIGTLLLLEAGSKVKTSLSYQTAVHQESSNFFATMVIEQLEDLHPANSK